MASRGRGRRGRLRGTGQAPPLFDQQAFTEVVGIIAVDPTRSTDRRDSLLNGRNM